MFNNLEPLHCKIPSSIENAGAAVESILIYLQQIYGSMDDEVAFDIKVVLNELILNAIRHGNKEDQSKEVKVTAGICKHGCAYICVEDSGAGYEQGGNNPAGFMQSGSTFEELKESGRGLILVNSLCNKVNFYSKGSIVEICKELRKKPEN